MKYLLISFGLLLKCFCFGQSTISEAQKIAIEEDKKILLVFTGSDWCKPCIQLKKNILETVNFVNFSDSKIVQLYVDFPYKRKNKLSKEQTLHNEGLAETYNKSGDFPKMVLIDNALDFVKTIQYNSKMKTNELISEIENAL